MQVIKTLITSHKYQVVVLIILAFAAVLRFYNYNHRWGLAYDQAHDALVARYAVEHGKIPLLGPFSSAGPFQTGGEWYWLLMIPTFIYPYSVLSPWIFLTFLYLVFVGIMIFIGNKLEGRLFSIIVGLFAAVSTAQIAQGVSLTNQTPQSLIAALAILYMVKFIQGKKTRSLFLMSLCISLAASIHLQGAALVFLLIATIVLSRSFNIKYMVAALCGLIIPAFPILFYDLKHDFFNVKNMFHYYWYDQYKISLDVLGRRWLTFAGVFIPQSWSFVIGGFPIVAYLQIVGVVFLMIYAFVKNKLKIEWIIVALSISAMIVVLKYTRTPLFDSYLVFLHPFVLLVSAYVVLRIISINRIVGILVLLIIVVLTSVKNIPYLGGEYDYTAHVVSLQKKALLERYPDKKFAIYDRELGVKDKSLPLVLFLDIEGKIDDNGHKVGVIIQTMQYEVKGSLIYGDRGGYQLFDLNRSSDIQLSKDKWAIVNPSEIYRSTEEWDTRN